MFHIEKINKNSKIANFIYENPMNWKELLREKSIQFHNKGNRWIFNYETINCDYNDPIVQEARGIILEIDEEIGSISVVCWPFRKFGNYQEGYVDEIDWNTAKVQEKVDGSIIKLYFYNGEWIWATNGRIDANDAPLVDYSGTFYNLIEKCSNYKDIPFDSLDKNNTYIFELTTKQNKVVIKYKEEKMYHIGTKNNMIGKELVVDIGIVKPKEYALSSLEDCIEAAKQLNKGNEVVKEGFVVVDSNFNRIKIKSPSYIGVHHLVTGCITKRHFLEAISTNFDLTDYLRNSEMEVQYFYYKYKYVEMKRDIEELLFYARRLYEEYEHDRKAVALEISKNKYAFIGFKGLDNDKNVEEFLKELPYSALDKMIPDYHHKNFWE